MLSIRHLEDGPWFSSAGLVVRGVGLRETMPPSFIERPRGTGDCLFMMFHDSVEIGRDSARKRLTPPSIIFWSRTSPHFYGNLGRRWTHSWIHCDGSVVRKMLKRAGATTDVALPLADSLPIERCLAAIHEEILLSAESADAVVIHNLLENLIRKGVARPNANRTARLPVGVAAAKSAIDSRYQERFTLDSLAQIARQSPRHFCTEFGRHLGIPPIAYLNQRRLHAAAALLRGTDEPVAAIGRYVGLSDPYYFSKLFKSCFGVCPTSLRRRSVGHGS
jgi:AraC family transcriptional regulator of arabinose operon